MAQHERRGMNGYAIRVMQLVTAPRGGALQAPPLPRPSHASHRSRLAKRILNWLNVF